MKNKEILITVIGTIIGGLIPIINEETRMLIFNNWRIVFFFLGLLIIFYAFLSMTIRKFFDREVKEKFANQLLIEKNRESEFLEKEQQYKNEMERFQKLYHIEAIIIQPIIKYLLDKHENKKEIIEWLFNDLIHKGEYGVTIEELKKSRIIPYNIIDELIDLMKIEILNKKKGNSNESNKN